MCEHACVTQPREASPSTAHRARAFTCTVSSRAAPSAIGPWAHWRGAIGSEQADTRPPGSSGGLARRPGAVHRQRRAGYLVGRIRAQEDGERPDLVGCREFHGRLLLFEELLLCPFNRDALVACA